MKLLSKILIHTHGINTHQWACSFLFKLCLQETLATCEIDINSHKKNYVGMSQTGYEFFGYFWDDGFWSC